MEVVHASRPHQVMPSDVSIEDAAHTKDSPQLLSTNKARQEDTLSLSTLEKIIGKLKGQMEAKEEVVKFLQSTNAQWQDRVKQLESQVA